ncbi:MAG: hypothetical protein DDT38_01374 [Firmicutes bacterium]|nr:hypothetical protein [candidate division NPL-UPA2 bacterium]
MRWRTSAILLLNISLKLSRGPRTPLSVTASMMGRCSQVLAPITSAVLLLSKSNTASAESTARTHSRTVLTSLTSITVSKWFFNAAKPLKPELDSACSVCWAKIISGVRRSRCSWSLFVRPSIKTTAARKAEALPIRKSLNTTSSLPPKRRLSRLTFSSSDETNGSSVSSSTAWGGGTFRSSSVLFGLSWPCSRRSRESCKGLRSRRFVTGSPPCESKIHLSLAFPLILPNRTRFICRYGRYRIRSLALRQLTVRDDRD